MSNTLPPPPPPMVYANSVEYPRHKGRVTPETWLDALMELQRTAQALASMRDVWEWERSGGVAQTAAHRVDSPSPQRAEVRICARCGSPVYRAYARYCSAECKREVGREKEKAKQREAASWRKPRPCNTCAAIYTPTHNAKVYCSEECRREAVRQSDARRKLRNKLAKAGVMA